MSAATPVANGLSGDTVELPDPASFIATCRERGIATAIIAWQREWAQIPAQATVGYDRIELAVLLGYRAGLIVRCTCSGAAADLPTLRRQLETAGLAVEERCRNLM